METGPTPPCQSDRLIEQHGLQEAEYKENLAFLELTLPREAGEIREAENVTQLRELARTIHQICRDVRSHGKRYVAHPNKLVKPKKAEMVCKELMEWPGHAKNQILTINTYLTELGAENTTLNITSETVVSWAAEMGGLELSHGPRTSSPVPLGKKV